jgi:hypothetical protein
MILSNDRKLLGTHRGGYASNVLLGVALIVMTGLPIAYLLA